jgi:two-component system sensor histidine kinase VanS
MYGVLRIFMPKAYQNEITAELSNNAQKLVKQLETSPMDEWERLLISFCMDNSTGATVLDENNEQVAGFGVSVYTITDGVVDDNKNTSSAALVIPFEKDGKQYTATANVNVNSVEQVTGIFAKVFPYVLIIILIISAFAAFFYSRFLAKPIVDISNVSKKMTALNMSWRCDVSRSDEIGTLAANLNEMAVKLDSTMRELQTANEKLQKDIEREREQERRRRDFFSAISHELKTPVTILKGELDGMILNVGKFKDRDKYLQEAYETTESVEKLVREILTLSKLDTLSLNMEETPLSVLTDECYRMYENMAQDKHIEIDRCGDEDIRIHADKKQMQTVISNVIGNAVKHSPENSVVTISISKENRAFSVENSGVYIDAAELPRLWEPFYRTDKSRSRDTGGSGLGLYIVKTILDNHGFEYRLENTEFGIRFTIVFPL